MQYKRQEMESETFPLYRLFSKRIKMELVSPTDSGFGDSDSPPLNPDSLESLPDGTKLLEKHRQRDLKYFHRGSTDSDYHSDGSDGKDLHKEHDSGSLPRVFDGTDITEPLLEELDQQDSENAYCESTDTADSGSLSDIYDSTEESESAENTQYDSDRFGKGATDSESLPGVFDGTEGSELFAEKKERNYDYSKEEATYSEYLPGEFNGTNDTEVLEEYGEHESEFSNAESTNSFTDDIDGVVELEEHKKFNSQYSERGSTESFNSPDELEQVNEIELLRMRLCPFTSLNEYLWQPRFNDDSSYYNVEVTEETEEQQFQRAIRNSLMEHLPDKREVKLKRGRSRRVRYEENKIDSRRVRVEENEMDSRRNRFEGNEIYSRRVRFDEKKTVSKRVRFEESERDSKRNRFQENEMDSRRVHIEEKKTVSKRVRLEESERDVKRVRFEENETDPITRCSEFRSKGDFIFPQFNVTGDVRTLHPEKFSESSEELSKKGYHFIANLLRSMAAKGQVGPKIDDEVRNLVLDMKEKMKGDERLQIHWLAACLLQLYTDLHKQLDGVLQFAKRTGCELDKIYDKMAEMSGRYLSNEPDCHRFREIMEYLDDLQVEVFLDKGEGVKGHFNALKVLANVMKGSYEGRLTRGNSDKDADLNLSRVISFFCPLLVNLCDTAFHTVKKCKEFYRVRNYVLSSLRKN